MYRCSACAFVTGEPAATTAEAVPYLNTYSQPHAPDPEARYHEWLSRAEGVVGKGRLLEVGAGGGGFVRIALQRGWEVHATETSPSAIERLRSLGAGAVFEGDLPALALPSSTYDLVVALEVVEHVHAPSSHLAETFRLLKPGGMLLLTTPNFDGLSRRWWGLRWRVIGAEHVGYFTGSTLTRTLKACGYSSIRVRSRSLDLSTWRTSVGKGSVGSFDPHASARMRDAVEGSRVLRTSKDTVNRVLGLTGLGDSLLAWAQSPR